MVPELPTAGTEKGGTRGWHRGEGRSGNADLETFLRDSLIVTLTTHHRDTPADINGRRSVC